MQSTKKLPNSAWIAHDINTTDVFNKTLRSSLIQCKITYIKEHFLTAEELMLCTLREMGTPNVMKQLKDEFILNSYEHLIPCNIEFVIVTLEPRYETTVKGNQ